MTTLSKSKMYQLLFAVCVICLSFALATQSFAAERGKWVDRDRKSCDRHYGRHHQIWPLLMRLDLNATQEKEIRGIRNSMLKNMIQEKADLKIARLELRELLHNDPVDMAAVESQVKKMEGLRTSMILDGIKARQEIKSKLTPGQSKKLKELIRNSWQGQYKPGVHKREKS
jgi:Spy/CpxP family protein refolding chaperone